MHRARRGVSTLEILTTLTLLGLAATAAVSGFGTYLQESEAKGLAGEVASDLQFIRTEAVSRNEAVRLTFSALPGGGSCYILHTGPQDACTCGAAGPAVCSGRPSIKTVRIASPGRVQLAANVPSILYDPRHGTASPAGTVFITTSDGRSVRHVVSLMGRVRTCSPEGALRGYRPC